MVMLRILLYVAAVLALFAGAIFYGGNAIGAWDPLPPAPEPPPAVKLSHHKAKEKKKPAATTPSAQRAPRKTAAQKAFVKKTNAVCRVSRSQVQAVLAQGNTSTHAGVVELFQNLKTVNAELNDRFLAIPVPPGYKDDVAELRELFAKEELYFESMGRALQSRDMKRFYAMNDRLTDIALDETDILANLGAYACDISVSSAFS